MNLKTYANMMKGSENGPVITPGKAQDSELVKLMQEGKMPKRASRLSDAEIKVIADWVNAGATDN